MDWLIHHRRSFEAGVIILLLFNATFFTHDPILKMSCRVDCLSTKKMEYGEFQRKKICLNKIKEGFFFVNFLLASGELDDGNSISRTNVLIPMPFNAKWLPSVPNELTVFKTALHPC